MRIYKTTVAWNNPHDPIVKSIIGLARDGRTLREIWCSIGKICSHETVRKWLTRFPDMFGADVLNSEKNELSPREAAKKLHSTPQLICTLCNSLKITGCRKVGHGPGRWLITEEGLTQLHRHPAISHKMKCEVCKRTFKSEKIRKKTCSEKCRATREKKLAKKLLRQNLGSHTKHPQNRMGYNTRSISSNSCPRSKNSMVPEATCLVVQAA
jgi:hypothetical protein